MPTPDVTLRAEIFGNDLHRTGECYGLPTRAANESTSMSHGAKIPMVRALAVVALLGGVAHADGYYDPKPEPPAREGPFVTAAVHFGLGAPLGLLGVEAGLGNGPLRGAVGAGLGLRGLELGAMGRAMTQLGGLDVGLGVGVSRGPGTHELQVGWHDASDPDETLQFGNGTTWANVELDVELVANRWYATRFYAGASYAFSRVCEVDVYNGDTHPCDPGQGAMLDAHPWMPYVGIAVVFRYPGGPPRQTVQLPQQPMM